MIRVLSIIHHTEFSGPTNRNIRIAPLLKEKGVDLLVLIPEAPVGSAYHRLKQSGSNLLTTRLNRLRSTKNLSEQIRFASDFFPDIAGIRKIIRRHDIDIVQLNGFMNPHGAIAAKLEDRKVVWQLIDTRSPPALRYLLMPLTVLLSDAVMSTGRKTAAEYPFTDRLSGNLFTFHPPVDIDRFTPDPDSRRQARETFGFRPEDVVVGTVGTLNPQKGHRHFIDAACLLKQFVDARFVVLGSVLDSQTAYYEDIRRYCREKGLRIDRDLFFFNPEDRVHFWEQAFDFFWMTSVPRSEGIPTAIEEAMTLGVPVIATDVGAVSEIVVHGSTGYLAAPFDAPAMAGYTRRLIERPSTRMRLVENAQKMAETHFSAECCAARHHECYRHVLGRR